ncbi:hydrogenase expression protein HupH [Antarctobacter heliothermus]|uniref:Hydrogenase expression protein HupH n=1 Tax=Antarctobacter heliothermus TaxID=74033 RepID=A0A222E1E0_9RHOB|nr:aspartate/glutamate racemase family protein [Antarctobacter heliothermus]ASP20035.1 hydrogenase expression protein HupH [Antarctobacter heliothermus]MBT52118.1 hydrogenase expression protein HupH [Mameliella sp.]|tara:strand:- start:1647 stop:2306 length:660 start_codon:yes stop_codon:yes gene_type:complete
MKITLVNPNSSRAVTEAMVAIARSVAPGVTVQGVTIPDAPPTILNPDALDAAAIRVAALAPSLAGAVIVAGFGDPGLMELRAAGLSHATGLAEASIAEAAALAPRFAVVTTTPQLVGRIDLAAQRASHDGYAGTWVTPGDPQQLMSDASALTDALLAACQRACAEAERDGALGAIIIGGGPLAVAARTISADAPVPLIEPVPAAVRRLLATAHTDGIPG